MEDLIPDEDLVVSITRGGYAKRTRADQYRTQKRGGKGVRGASLRGDDVVEHFIATTNHHWLLFFTTAGRVYRTKAYNLPEASRDAKGGHVAGLLSFQPDESIAQVLAIRDYEQAPYLVLATRNGLVKKTRLGDYNSPRQAGVIAINFREDDDVLIGAELVNSEDDILLVSRKGQAIRFRADDAQLRPMGRATSGVSGMKFRDGDSLLSMSVIRATQVAAEEAAGLSEETEDSAGVQATSEQVDEVKPQYVFTITDGGYAKRTRINEYRLQSRGGLGIKAMSLTNADRGGLVGAFIVEDGDEVLSITQNGQVVRSPINEEFRPTGRSTMGVKFVTPKSGDAVAVVARSVEAKVDEEVAEAAEASAEEIAESAATDPAVQAAAVETADLAEDVEEHVAEDGEGDVAESADAGTDATIESGDASQPGAPDLPGAPTDGESDG
jgi:DNA gyrase subunit A